MSYNNLVIVNNEKVFKENNSFYCDNLDLKIIPEELKLWDTVVAIGGVPINNGIEFAEEMNKHEIGKKVSVTIIRKKRFIQLDLMIKVFEVPVDKMYDRPGVVKP